ncbi:interleukin-15 [Lissotriton helveticus]
MKYPVFSDKPKPKAHQNRKDLQCCVHYPIHDCVLKFLNGEAGLYVFVLCCISACFPKTEASHEAYWMEMITDLTTLKGYINGSDAILYSGTSIKDKDSCRKAVLWCYLKELESIVRESKILGKMVDEQLMNFLWENSCLSKTLAENHGDENCLPCEMYPEKAYIDFIEDLTHFFQELHTQSVAC